VLESGLHLLQKQVGLPGGSTSDSLFRDKLAEIRDQIFPIPEMLAGALCLVCGVHHARRFSSAKA
jgi:hypothetical protein